VIINSGAGYVDPYALALGESAPTRMLQLQSQAQTLAAMRVSCFTAAKTETTSQVRVSSGTTASVTLDLARIGLYLLSTDATRWDLVAATASDTSLFGTVSTPYTRSWQTPYAKVAGRRYAHAQLQVAAAGTAGSLLGVSLGSAAEAAIPPRVSGQLVAGLTDLPASFLDSALTTSAQMIYAAILP
jgi:hypothetical protein